MSRYTSPYQFYDDLEMRDAGYEYKYPKVPAISWSEEDSPQWAYMGEGRQPDWTKHLYPSEWCRTVKYDTGGDL